MPEIKITNEQIATEVMGWTMCLNWYCSHISLGHWLKKDDSCGHNDCHPAGLETNFLTDHNAAMLVVKQVQKQGWHWTMDLFSDGWYVRLRPINRSGDEITASQHESLCVAICEAALKAVRP